MISRTPNIVHLLSWRLFPICSMASHPLLPAGSEPETGLRIRNGYRLERAKTEVLAKMVKPSHTTMKEEKRGWLLLPIMCVVFFSVFHIFRDLTRSNTAFWNQRTSTRHANNIQNWEAHICTCQSHRQWDTFVTLPLGNAKRYQTKLSKIANA